jgi:SnoaL-like polyketide cyclase
MSTDNKQIVRRLFNDLWNKGNLGVADEILASSYVRHDPASPDFGTGPEAEKQLVTLYRSAFPDTVLTIDQMIDADKYVTTRYTASGTHRGELRGIKPTNRAVKVEGVIISRISRGRIAESWVVWDALGLTQQLGVVPALENAKAQASK